MSDKQGVANDISVFLRTLYSRRYVILAVSGAFGILGLVLSFVLDPVYTSQATFFVTSSDQGGVIPPSLKSAASLAGISVGGADDTKSQEAIAILKSNNFALNFIAKHNLLQELFPKEW